MRDWTLGPGDPLVLTLAADFRLCTPDYLNDHIWELEISGGDPPALALRTTYGLRARTMRIFPRFTLGGVSVSNPADFSLPPRLCHFFPNFLALDFSPFSDIHVKTEYWAPDSHTVAGRFTIKNRRDQRACILLELCGQLVPLDGQSMAPLSMQSANVLAGRAADLVPVIFLTGGPRPGMSPYPSLALEMALSAGESRTFTWVEVALKTAAESLEAARRTAARPWVAERTRIEMVNAAQTIDVHTGDPDWDATFAFSQKIAFGSFFGPSQYLPYPSFVLSRQPDQGYSPRGDGRDYSPLWSGQPLMEAHFLASLLPGAPELAVGLVRNHLSVQMENGLLDWKPGLAGQRGRWQAIPLLATLAWRTFQDTQDMDFLREIQPRLEAFTQCWFDRSHDRDGDGFPEWDHALQAGLEDLPAYSVWQDGGQGANISTSESPALAALLCGEAMAQAHIAEALFQPENCIRWEKESERLRTQVEECWDEETGHYRSRDRDTHRSPAGKLLGSQRGAGKLVLSQSFEHPVRLLIRLELKGEITRRPEIRLTGHNGEMPQTERLDRMDFQWGGGVVVATSQMVYSDVTEVEASGLEKNDRVSVFVVDFSTEDVTLFLPLWAGIPNPERAQELVRRSLLSGRWLGGAYGIPLCPTVSKRRPSTFHPDSQMSLWNGDPASLRAGELENLNQVVEKPLQRSNTTSTCVPPPRHELPAVCRSVQMPWNELIGEGLLGYGLQAEAAQLTGRLMAAVIQNLKQQHAFKRAYHAESGEGMGERNSVQGLAPFGLFLYTLGVRIESPYRVILSGKNPFPWPVTVKYRGLTVTRQADQTVVIFPDEQKVTLDDPTDAVVSAATLAAQGSG
jgi:hypothetical protein